MEVQMIKWSEIEAECGDYRNGFVATFRKYEGQETDEVDGSNRRVTVTATSFARHMGIAHATFDRWLKVVSGPDITQDKRDELNAKQARRELRRLPPEEVAKIVREQREDPAVAEEIERQDEAESVITEYDRRMLRREAAAQAASETEQPGQGDPGRLYIVGMTALAEIHDGVEQGRWTATRARESLTEAAKHIQEWITELDFNSIVESGR